MVVCEALAVHEPTGSARGPIGDLCFYEERFDLKGPKCPKCLWLAARGRTGGLRLGASVVGRQEDD